MGQPVFEVYNADGSLQMNLSSRLTKFLGAFTFDLAVSGSLVDPILQQGTPWYCCLAETDNYAQGSLLPVVTFSGSTMHWERRAFGSTGGLGTLIYGVYSNGSN